MESSTSSPPSQASLDAAGVLRARAVALFQQRADPAVKSGSLSPQASAQLLHEFALHQIELEIQNEELRNAQQALDTAQAGYFDFYDLAPVGFCSVDENGLVRQVNLTAASLLGLPRQQLIHQPISHFIFKDDQDIYYLLRRKLLDAGQAPPCELRLEKRGSPAFWVQLAAVLARDDKGMPVLRLVISDITERKHAEDALKQSEERWQFALESGGDGLWDWNLQTGAAFFSPRYKEMFGYAEHEFENSAESWSKRVHPDDAPAVMAALQPYLNGKAGTASVEFRMLCKDGSWLWTLGRGKVVSRDASGKATRMIGTNTDISERKQAEIIIRESESRFRSLMENITGVAVQGYALDGTVLFWNLASERLYGYSATEALGANLLNLTIPHDQLEGAKTALQQMAASEQAMLSGERMCKTKSGALTPVFSNCALVKPIGREPELFCLDIDLRERNKARDALKQSEAFKEAILNSVAAEIVVIDGNGVILAVNQQWRKYALDNALEPGQVAPNTDIGSNYLSICTIGAQADARARQACDGISAVLQGRLPSFSMEYPCHSPGRQRWFNMVVMPLGDSGQGASITHTDVTAIKQADERVLSSESHLRAIFETALDAMISMDDRGCITDWNHQAQTIFGWSKDEVLGLDLHDTIAPEHYRVAHHRGLARFLATGQSDILSRRMELTGLRRNGEEFPIALSILPFKTGDGYRFTAFVDDISERKRVTAALQESEQKFRLIAENTSDGITIFDKNGHVQYVSPAVMRQLGSTEQEELARTNGEVYSIMHPDDRDEVFAKIDEAIKDTKDNLTYSYRVKHQSGHYFWREDNVSLIFDCNQEYGGAYVISRDISERKRLEEQVRQLAFFDPLTQLPNRRMLGDRLSQTMALSKRSGRYAAVMVLDLDNFKPLNDKHGHLVGDMLLVEVASRLLHCVRAVDTVARFGGDEFIVVLGELDVARAESRAQAKVIAEKIRASLSAPYVLPLRKEGGTDMTIEHHCSASIGVVVFANHETPHADILRWADAAMYQAKDAGRNRIQFYEIDTYT
ncbi:MAG: PAS domain S-box protein [Comamonadaceae bacterium]|nr:PAS domain S-box protein [Comamonadaceae bacterium]